MSLVCRVCEKPLTRTGEGINGGLVDDDDSPWCPPPEPSTLHLQYAANGLDPLSILHHDDWCYCQHRTRDHWPVNAEQHFEWKAKEAAMARKPLWRHEDHSHALTLAPLYQNRPDDGLVAHIGQKTTGYGKSVLLEPQQVKELRDVLTAWLEAMP